MSQNACEGCPHNAVVEIDGQANSTVHYARYLLRRLKEKEYGFEPHLVGFDFYFLLKVKDISEAIRERIIKQKTEKK
jgi:hypothetical protein